MKALGSSKIDILVVGHLCIELILGMDQSHRRRSHSLADSMNPRQFNFRRVGRLQIRRIIIAFLPAHATAMPEIVTVAHGVASSYTNVHSPERSDRDFLHYLGANDQFEAENVDLDVVERENRSFRLSAAFATHIRGQWKRTTQIGAQPHIERSYHIARYDNAGCSSCLWTSELVRKIT